MSSRPTRSRVWRAAFAATLALTAGVAGSLGWSGCVRGLPECTGIGPGVCQHMRDERARDEAFARAGWSRPCHQELAIDYRGGASDRAWLDASVRACAQSEVRACTVVAKAYAFGCRVEPDLVYARELFRWSCAADDLDACYAFDRASDEPSDEQHFNPHIQRILDARCARGDAGACIDLASLTWNGYRATPQSRSRTLELLKAPCDGGHVEACRKLAFYSELAGRTR